jgi:hypothetical protein
MSETTVLRHERLSTFAAWVGHPNAGSVLIGHVRLDARRRVLILMPRPSDAEDRRHPLPFAAKPTPRVGHETGECQPPARLTATFGRPNESERSHATNVAPSRGVWQGVPRLPTGRFKTQHAPSADRCHLRIGTVRCGLIERGS